MLSEEIRDLIDEANALKMYYSLNCTGRMFHAKLIKLINKVINNFDADWVHHITELNMLPTGLS